VFEKALSDALPDWYEQAMIRSEAVAVGEPKLDVSEAPAEGDPLKLSIEVAVRPPARLGEYRGLEVGRAEPELPSEEVDAELERLREGFASLRPVERAAGEGNFLLIDYAGTVDGEPIEGGEGHDVLIELGSESLLDGFDEALRGAEAGGQRTVAVTFPDDYRPEELAGKEATFEVKVTEVREKDLPDLDDEFAADASEFETLDELRAAVAEKLGEAVEQRVEAQFREAAVDAAAEAATVEVPEDVATARAEEIWTRFERSLEARGVAPESYLRMQGRSREELVADAREDAEQGLRREAVLAAVADAEGIEVSEGELLEALGGSEANGEGGDGDGEEPAKTLARLRETGRDALLRDDLRLRKAADLVAEAAKPIPLDRAEARERLWTPEKESDERGELWTPGQE
jgi:trigger factor